MAIINAMPMNARHHHVNESGREPARFASVNDLRYLLNLFRNEDFVFANPAGFPERRSGLDHRTGRHWETDLVADLAAVAPETRDLVLAQGSIGAELCDLAPGARQSAQPHPAGSCCFAVTGQGSARLGQDGPDGATRIVDWRPGMVYAPPPDLPQELVNPGPHPARHLTLRMGSARYPLFRGRGYNEKNSTDTPRADGKPTNPEGSAHG